MTMTLNQEGDHLSRAHASFFVARKHGAIQSWHRSARSAVQWMTNHADSINGWQVTKSFVIRAAYWDRSVVPNREFEPELLVESPTFPAAMDALASWLHQSWEQERDNHPSPVGRQQAWERWHDVIALANISSLTLLPNPAFQYAFGRMSPPEGKGHDLRLSVFPTSASELDLIVERNRGCEA